MWKRSPLVMILRVIIRSIFTANGKYPFLDCENLPRPIQMQLSLKPKTFSYSFVQFLESTSNFKHFQEKYESHSYFFSEIRDCERLF